ncbi:hypothetical protein P154DRAFT_579420 [Amniculicola lignicola CBS 123094]|uniref:Uncharacterized protein n=1 Tax=Amniculicola lignicola CBS 123094 TaxID=1392246 RepID=A0A6A5W6H1_9PLEO|nr:hypothetical protein P154DRAFT_579420 [Amniculicola lignicola CBS 123094]
MPSPNAEPLSPMPPPVRRPLPPVTPPPPAQQDDSVKHLLEGWIITLEEKTEKVIADPSFPSPDIDNSWNVHWLKEFPDLMHRYTKLKEFLQAQERRLEMESKENRRGLVPLNRRLPN